MGEAEGELTLDVRLVRDDSTYLNHIYSPLDTLNRTSHVYLNSNPMNNKRRSEQQFHIWPFAALVDFASGPILTVPSMTGTASDGDFNSFNFWKAPIDAAPTLPEAIAAIAPPTFALIEPTANGAPPQQHMVTQHQIRKLDKMLKPMPVENMSTADIQARLAEFEADFRKRHGRRIALADTHELPKPVLEMYDQLGRRLSPEEREKAQARLEARQAAVMAAKAQAEAEAAVADEKRAAAAAARAMEWETFQANKEAVWRAASSEAREQREEAAAEHGLSASSLTGASTWLKVDEPGKREQSKEEMIEQFRLERGLSARREELTEEQRQREAAEWSAKGGAEADALARQEAWTKRT